MMSLTDASFLCFAIIRLRPATLLNRMCATGSRSLELEVHSKTKSTLLLAELGPTANAMADLRLCKAAVCTWVASAPYIPAGMMLQRTILSFIALVMGIHRNRLAMVVACLSLAVRVAPLLFAHKFMCDPRSLNEDTHGINKPLLSHLCSERSFLVLLLEAKVKHFLSATLAPMSWK